MFEVIVNYNETNSYTDNVSMSLRYRHLLFTFSAFLKVRIYSSFRFLQKQMPAL